MNVTDEEVKLAADVLKKLSPGFLPFELFHQFARLTVTPIIEVVPLKMHSDGTTTTILLTRDHNDPAWPGMKHTPGTVLRASDNEGDFSSAIDRIIEDELEGIEIKGESHLVTTVFHQVNRGREIALVFFIEYISPPPAGEEVNVQELPTNIIDTQLDFITKAVEKFMTYKNTKYE